MNEVSRVDADWLAQTTNQTTRSFQGKINCKKSKRWRHHYATTTSLISYFLSAGPCESSAACYWVVNINLNLLSWHVVTFWWIFRMTFLKIQFSKNIFEIIRPRDSDPNSTLWYTTYNEMEFISCVSAAFIPNLLP